MTEARPMRSGGWIERALARVGVRDRDARLLAATPSLRLSWAAAGIATIGAASWAARSGDAEAVWFFLIGAPLLPVAAVAAAYGALADPMYEIAQATPLSSLRLLLLRSAAVLVPALAIVACGSLALPAREWTTVAWILPSLGLVLASLALSTFVPIHRAAVLVVLAWIVTIVLTEIRSGERFAAFRGPGQVVFFIVSVASSCVLAWRRDRIEREGRADRRRMIDVAEAERRRIERNIHDGAQQQLVAISVKLGLARTFVQRDPERAAALLGELQLEAQDALEALREMTRGADPPILADEGLAAALAARARRGPVPIEIEAPDVGRFPREVETAVYFCCLEAVQNASKYARASRIVVGLRRVGDDLAFSVADDGLGFDPGTARRGVGLRSMTERVEAMGGELEVRSVPGAGTTVRGRVPLRSPPTA